MQTEADPIPIRYQCLHVRIRLDNLFIVHQRPIFRYRFQYDGRLQRSLETAVMLMETFDRLSRQDKYVWDVRRYRCLHSASFADVYVLDYRTCMLILFVRFGLSA